MRELPLQFEGRGEASGYNFTQIEKSDFAYIYERTSPEGHLSWEVFKRIENERFGNVSYPRSPSFGVWAWQYFDKDKAVSKYIALNNPETLEKQAPIAEISDDLLFYD